MDKNILRKHKHKEFFAISLPVSTGRELFVTKNDITQRYFSIEHYFSNEILISHNMKGDNILNTEVFYITGNKNDFAKKCCSFNAKEFNNFSLLFEKIKEIIFPTK